MRFSKILTLTLILLTFGCGDDEGDGVITVTTADFTITVDENQVLGASLGVVSGSTNQGSVTFSLISQTPGGPFAIDGSTGELTVANATLFDFETNPTLTAVVQVANGGVSENSMVTVNLNDVNEGPPPPPPPPPIIWSGAPITFSKASNADHTLEANQDRITDDIWITRANNMGIFNIKAETAYTKTVSPAGTEWAFGTTANIASLNFQVWAAAVNFNPRNGMVGQDMVVRLISENIFIDIRFLNWVDGMSGGGGGGFSYTRSTE